MFQFDPRLDTDIVFIYAFPLCDVRLMLDANYPWLILVPRQGGLREHYMIYPKPIMLSFSLESAMISGLMSVHFCCR